jgi:hypothetical protein
MADPEMYILVTCAECDALILKPHTTPASTFTAYSYRPAIEISKAPRHAAGDGTAICSQCRGKTAAPTKVLPK